MCDDRSTRGGHPVEMVAMIVNVLLWSYTFLVCDSLKGSQSSGS
jgi:hypothetical protein